ncbi:spore coat U domain-containing protein [Xylophilus sp. GOD-11R]|uniref:Csu type fimbrial protein n=1 Tax=Xylophilus sp. GOD-11R TaxID=3089814 RepID=UPI00298D4E02|nr:spore coat U domain-containing protein [Xylophilus sp. GOD-11R]WPB59316.1 spore coat U domain-containing protein [Xylophilus sp. GOD-11R]
MNRSSIARGARRRASLWCRALLAASIVGNAQSACTVSTAGLAFGSYDPFAAAALDSTGDISIECAAVTAFTVRLASGSGGAHQRRLGGPGQQALAYNLYVDAARTTAWGDGSAGTATAGGSGTAVHLPVYARVPAGQNVEAGSYMDSVTILVEY